MNVDELIEMYQRRHLGSPGRRIRQVRFRSREDALRLLGQEDTDDPRLDLPAPGDARPVWPGGHLEHIPVVWDPELGPDEIEIDWRNA